MFLGGDAMNIGLHIMDLPSKQMHMAQRKLLNLFDQCQKQLIFVSFKLAKDKRQKVFFTTVSINMTCCNSDQIPIGYYSVGTSINFPVSFS